MKLKGNSGLIYDDDGKLVMHIAAPYDSNGLVFAIIQEDNELPTWERMTIKEAHKRNLGIINCCQCNKPATQVDHYWPFCSGQNLCDDCEYDPWVDC